MAIQYFWRHPLAEQVREEGRQQGLKEARERGRVQARAEMVLRLLEWRGIPVPDAVRDRVTTCTDLDQLQLWAQRAVHATDAAQLFADQAADQ
ncbi:hypothetical protein [Streptomyces sp. NPDC127190]|uniref:hypothetical protein n=1 Tax=unclassified Streptomyces TaxID=2593676 RepID=UPI00363CA128